MTIRILQAAWTDRRETVGFRIPFGADRLCEAIGANLGGNRPREEWFAGWDIMVAVRQATNATPHMPTAALLRRTSDGALRIVASDHIKRGHELGADLIIGPQHVGWVLEAIAEACSPGEGSRAIAFTSSLLDHAVPADSDEPANLLTERMRDDDVADGPRLREFEPLISEMSVKAAKLQSATRRTAAQRLIETLAATLSL